MAYDYDLLSARLDRRVLFVTIDAPPINVMTAKLYEELTAFTSEVEIDDGVGRELHAHQQVRDPETICLVGGQRTPGRISLARRRSCPSSD